MKHIENTNLYKADEGCFIVRKADNFIVGNIIDVGNKDNIDNYERRDKYFLRKCRNQKQEEQK